MRESGVYAIFGLANAIGHYIFSGTHLVNVAVIA